VLGSVAKQKDGNVRYDVIVIGAGSAGAVIATRLTEDAGRSVLLDAGPDYADVASTPDDLLNGHWNSTRTHDWRFRGHHTISGRPHMFPRGRVVGGSSAVNTAIALRGTPEDYDEWAALGNTEWSWERVLPVFRAMEHDLDFADDFHGQSGPIPVRRYREDELVNWQAAFMRACRQIGYPAAADNNDPDSTGVGPHPMNKQGRLRISTAIAYLAEARSRPNLTVRGNSHVHRVLLSGGQAVGVLAEIDCAIETIHCGQVVLSAGAIQSPAILMRSGIGDRGELTALGMRCELYLPGVGRHLLDHPVAGLAFTPKEGVCRTDVPSVQVTMRYTASGSTERNDMQVQPVSFYTTPTGPVFGIGVCLERPRGEGRLILESLDPHAQPRIDSHFCEDPEDLRRMVEGMRIAMRIGETEPIRSLHTGFRSPRAQHLESDCALGEWIQLVADSGFHPCGTARMGSIDDDWAVVDQFGRLHGVDGLVVADASIMPSIPRANTNLSSIMIGERIGAWLRDGRISTPPRGGLTRPAAAMSEPVPGAQTSALIRARDRGAAFLMRRQRVDGMIGDETAAGLGGFCKGMYAFTAAGQSRAAARLADWLRLHGATSDGDFRDSGGAWTRGALADVYPYANAWLAAGLHRAGAYDLAMASMDFLAGMQDQESGGMYTAVDGRDASTRQEVLSSAMTGLAALVCGRLDVARGVARFLRTILAAQPDLTKMLCHVYTREHGVITTFADEEAARFAVIAARPRQAYFMYGIGAAFMARYSLAAREPKALDDAALFLVPALHATEAMYETAQVGKVAWGAALLAGMGGNVEHRDLALRSAGALLAQQNPDGSWDNTGGYSTEGVRDEVTAEFVSILDEVEQGLAGVPLSEMALSTTAAALFANANVTGRT